MTEDDLYPLLEPLAGGQVYPYVAPLGSDGKPSVSPPWIIFSIVDDVSVDVLCGQAESRVSVQVDVYSTSIAESRSLRDLALASLKQLNPTEVVKIPGYEPDYRLYRATLDFKVTP
ncbi:tail completion protein gp17 [Enterobacter hormaechei]|uniref:tail completion protein gp17 n=1 Tax=Enterobacter hormaechei TaxID=158836 RepID=UPI003D7EB9CB